MELHYWWFQFWPNSRLNTRLKENDSPENDFIVIEEASEEVTELFRIACFDCHSNTTKYPWHSNITLLVVRLKGT